MAPEVRMGRFTTKADLYSYGITIVSISQGSPSPVWPCGGDPRALNLGMRFHGTGLDRLLQLCLRVHPQARISMKKHSGLTAIQSIRQVLKQLGGQRARAPRQVLAGRARRGFMW